MLLKKKESAIILILLVFLLAINYSWLDSWMINSFSGGDFVKIDRIIDGDTIESNGTSVRMLGINTPEKGERYYEEAKNSLSEKVLNKTARLEYGKDRKDKYGRALAYVFLNGKNINLQQIEEGFANYYFPSGRDIYYNDFKRAWENCIEKNINLCESSQDICSNCIELKELDYKNQKVTLVNSCNFGCSLAGWTIKDEGRKKFVFPGINLMANSDIKIIVGNGTNYENILYWAGDSYVWTETGDTLFLRDSDGKLVAWQTY